MPQTPIPTQLADLHGATLQQITAAVAGPNAPLAAYAAQLINQVERPRPNIGTGPPGRAD